ncbi:hypothetical protein IMCC3317_00710 [Kordia antarctica]|uniref:DUF4252 domain-containing protein n=1 Tax=Kordia antarctica TaxID=1218801 RepID=A0A7L4ZDJ9_9FLAO|nr:DUF4252 domain-containing protein [Kordia antarctica]QHI34727.1 hypothetical protein IMCC3317_00710 [Kordia antarctica]
MRKIAILVMLMVIPFITFGQDIFEKYADNEEVAYVSIKPKMFKMLATMGIDSDDPDAKEFLNMVNSITSFKTIATSNVKISADLQKWVGKHSNNLEELMEVREGSSRMMFYVKSGKSDTRVEELLMYITGIEDKVKMEDRSINTVVVSLTGDIDLTQISKLTSKMDIPGGEHLKDAKRKKKN